MPTMFITRVRLQASTFSAISVATLGNRFIRKCVAPIRIFNVANGCPASVAPGSVDLIECDDDLERDQYYDNDF
jgi:hypothetical protein